jgi:hypothetical protein
MRIEASLLAEHQRFGNCDSGDLAEHVVDQLHPQSVPEPTDMEHILAHCAEQVLAGRKGLGWAADNYRQGRGCRAMRAAADRRIILSLPCPQTLVDIFPAFLEPRPAEFLQLEQIRN